MGVFNLSILLSICAAVALGQAQKKKDETDPSKVLTITDANWIKKIMHPGEKTHMLIVFESLFDCPDCRR